jgi:hypothetical protein
MRRLSLKHLSPVTFALFAAMIGVGCEDDGIGGLGFDAGFDSNIGLSPSPDGSTLPNEASTDGADAADSADAANDADAADVADAAAEGDAPDAGPAVVAVTAPLDGRVGVGTGTKIVVTFSTPMQAATVTVQATAGACSGSLQVLEGPTFTTCVGGTITTSDNVGFTYTPSANLGAELRYKVQVSAAALAVDGRALTPYAMTTGFMTQKFAVDAKVLYMANPATGDLGGIAGADTACSTKPTRPVGVVAAKAMLTAATRVACSVSNCGAGNAQLDWVLRPDQHYVRADGAYVFLTDGNGICTSYAGGNDLGSSLNFWDGLNADWTTRGPNCTDWTSTANSGAVGYDVGLNNQWLTGGELPCTSGRPFVCAEQ